MKEERPYYLWVDSNDKIRESRNPPTSNTVGKIIGETEAYNYFKRYLYSLNHCYYEKDKVG